MAFQFFALFPKITTEEELRTNIDRTDDVSVNSVLFQTLTRFTQDLINFIIRCQSVFFLLMGHQAFAFTNDYKGSNVDARISSIIRKTF